MNKTIKRARETLIHKGLCAIDGSGDPDIEALFAYIARAELVSGKTERFVVGIARKSQFEVMDNMAQIFPTVIAARQWIKKAKKSDYYSGAYFTIFKEISCTRHPVPFP